MQMLGDLGQAGAGRWGQDVLLLKGVHPWFRLLLSTPHEHAEAQESEGGSSLLLPCGPESRMEQGNQSLTKAWVTCFSLLCLPRVCFSKCPLLGEEQSTPWF